MKNQVAKVRHVFLFMFSFFHDMIKKMEGIYMPSEFNHSGQRYERRAKRRKTNIILNTLIAIVIILIFIVAYNIFIAGDTNKEKAATQANTEKIEGNHKNKPKDSKESAGKDGQAEESKSENDDQQSSEESSGLIEEEGDEPNVEKVIINPNWQPIGTQQTAGHEPSSQQGSADWNEKVAAVSYAVNIPVDQMTLWWLERGDDPENQAIATVSSRGAGSDVYRVHIEWVDGEGWKPTVVKKLIENDRKS
ncbi:YrrS family protein [Bacillus sp. FJAT-50079]|uniref:YrrS family protein n=1 Tax=Bacillus sp. FJAT-50079 TaxID=2833577 RepID=UPI001BC9582C|nr:YrrS family protein [Bacillus sp. FJAT-50079]MBS4209020.1 YrrS family protein [Bacillus sp. FJAT-50079]